MYSKRIKLFKSMDSIRAYQLIVLSFLLLVSLIFSYNLFIKDHFLMFSFNQYLELKNSTLVKYQKIHDPLSNKYKIIYENRDSIYTKEEVVLVKENILLYNVLPFNNKSSMELLGFNNKITESPQ